MTSVKLPEEKKDEVKVPVVPGPEPEVAGPVCVKCNDTGAVAIETKHNTVTGEDTVEKWGNCTNCYLDKDDAGNYVRKLGVRPDPAQRKKELEAKAKAVGK